MNLLNTNLIEACVYIHLVANVAKYPFDEVYCFQIELMKLEIIFINLWLSCFLFREFTYILFRFMRIANDYYIVAIIVSFFWMRSL